MFLICLRYNVLNTVNTHNSIISKEAAPMFIKGIEENETADDIKENLDTTIKSTVYKGLSRELSYFRSTITITQNSNFENNYAFGPTTTSGHGGAINIIYSILMISELTSEHDTVKFIKNQATAGGAICAVSSACLIYNTIFQNNTAFKYAGAVYFQGALITEGKNAGNLAPQSTFIGIYTNFTENTASEIGGAIAISYTHEFYLEECKFIKNRCGLGGGAIYANNCDDLKLMKSKFAYNTVNANDKTIRLNTMIRGLQDTFQIDDSFISQSPPRFVGHGGGAISFYSDSKKGVMPSEESTFEKRTINSQFCCFYKDSATFTGQTFSDSAGHEIVVDGCAYWISYKDFVSGFENNHKTDSVAKVTRAFPPNSTGWQVYDFQKTNNPEELEICSHVATIKEEEFPQTPKGPKISFAPSINSVNDNIASNPPAPTTFTYFATPITRLPSMSIYPSNNLSIPTTTGPRTVIGTDKLDPSLLFSGFTLPPSLNFTYIPILPEITEQITSMTALVDTEERKDNSSTTITNTDNDSSSTVIKEESTKSGTDKSPITSTYAEDDNNEKTGNNGIGSTSQSLNQTENNNPLDSEITSEDNENIFDSSTSNAEYSSTTHIDEDEEENSMSKTNEDIQDSSSDSYETVSSNSGQTSANSPSEEESKTISTVIIDENDSTTMIIEESSSAIYNEDDEQITESSEQIEKESSSSAIETSSNHESESMQSDISSSNEQNPPKGNNPSSPSGTNDGSISGNNQNPQKEESSTSTKSSHETVEDGGSSTQNSGSESPNSHETKSSNNSGEKDSESLENPGYKTPPATEARTPYHFIRSDDTKYTFTTSKVFIPISTKLSVKSGILYYNGSTYVRATTNIITDAYIVTESSTSILIELIENNNAKKSNLLLFIIIGAAICVILIASSIWLIVFFKKKQEETENESAVEMQEETVLSIQQEGVTHDNPLWTTTVHETDDPFFDDFEETRDQMISSSLFMNHVNVLMI